MVCRLSAASGEPVRNAAGLAVASGGFSFKPQPWLARDQL